ncbi:MAG: zinc ribbon domain-containing protein [Bacillota bacterium]
MTAAQAGRTVIAVDPRNTSQNCSSCGHVVPKELDVRVHECPHCGFRTDRESQRRPKHSPPGI